MEEWVCPKCGQTNEGYSGYCVRCAELREPVEEETGPPVTGRSAPASPPDDACEVCGRRPTHPFSFQASKGMVIVRQTSSFEGKLCLTCAQGKFREFQGINLSWGWFGLISFAAAIAYAFGNLGNLRRNRKGLAAPTPTDVETEKRLRGRPVAVRMLPGLAVLAVIVGVVFAVLSGGRGDVDDAYISDFVQVNDSRNVLIDLANSRFDKWVTEAPSTIPGPESLVASELERFMIKVYNMATPVSDELRDLHSAWKATVERLLYAEKTLASQPSTANAETDDQAWRAEDAAYDALYTYCKAQQ